MLRRCIALEPTFISAYKELVNLQRPEERGEYLKKVADLTPSDPYYKASFGDWLHNEGKGTRIRIGMHRVVQKALAKNSFCI